MIITYLAYLIMFMIICYVKKRARQLFKRINYMNDNRSNDDEDLESQH